MSQPSSPQVQPLEVIILKLDLLDKKMDGVLADIKERHDKWDTERGVLQSEIRKLQDWQLQIKTTFVPLGVLTSAVIGGFGAWIVNLLFK